MNFEKIPSQLIAQWGDKTLADFRREAECEATGTVYEAIRRDRGPRAILLMCITNEHQIVSLERVFTFADDRKQDEDWNALTLLEVFKRTALGHGFAYESLRDQTENEWQSFFAPLSHAQSKY
jgi:hypothetical protein